jgi:hypothetical protein
VELERQREAIARRGYGLAAISYDPVGVLKAFAERRGVALPMLSDEGSAVIRRFGLLNPEYPEGDLAHGVPYPGTFVVDAQGVIRQRIFQSAYTDRRTAASFLLLAGDPPEAVLAEHRSPGAELRVGTSNVQAAPGQIVTLAFDFALADGSWLCGDGDAGCAPPVLRLEGGALARVGELRLPAQRTGPARATADVTLAGGRAFTELLKQPDPKLPLRGALDYQVCGAAGCGERVSLPLDLALGVAALDRERAPEALRHKSRQP